MMLLMMFLGALIGLTCALGGVTLGFWIRNPEIRSIEQMYESQRLFCRDLLNSLSDKDESHRGERERLVQKLAGMKREGFTVNPEAGEELESWTMDDEYEVDVQQRRENGMTDAEGSQLRDEILSDLRPSVEER